MTRILKTYIGDIFCEFIVQNKIADTIILLPGFPSSNKMDSEMKFLYNKGYNVFFPRFKGSFQSKGFFLENNPVEELKIFTDKLKKEKIINLWNMEEVSFKINNLILFGQSFSGAISCGLVAVVNDFNKLVLFSPVWDFEKHNSSGEEQDLNHLISFVKRAYKNLYRIKFDNLVQKMSKFKEVHDSLYIKEIKIPILVLNDPNDKTVSIEHSKNLGRKLKNLKILEHNLGHGFNLKILENCWGEIEKYLKNK
jgi:pimeloyl-ACP methyl ester carboxylesterase